MSKFVRWIAPMVVALSAVGCADTLAERQGVAVDIVPIKHSYSIEVKQNNIRNAYFEIERYINDNWKKLAPVELELMVHSDEGEKIANHVKLVLRDKGKDPQLLSEIKVNADNSFDFTLVSHHHDTVTPVCDYYEIGYFGETTQGCFAENARWKSMVNPQKMSH